MRIYYRLLFILFISFTSSVNAQSLLDSVNLLQPVNISALRLNETTISQTLDTSINRLTATTLADQLSREGGLFIKSYGPGSLSTLSLRGSSASQTAVLWNGINICSPMLGLFDLTLIPTFLIDKATIQYGGSGATLGSGAIGGALHLDSKSLKEKGLEVEALACGGSFGFYEGGIGVSNYNGRIFTNTRIFSQGAINNFIFKNFNDELVTQSNAKFNQLGLTQDISINYNNNLFSFHGWYLKNEREIPPHMLTTSSKQKQEDEALRIAGEWKKSEKFWNWYLRSGWSREKLNYNDVAANIDDLSTSYSFQNEAEISYQKNLPINFKGNIYWIHNEAEESFYGSRQKVNQVGGTISANYSNTKFSVYADLKQGFHNGKALPLLPSISSSWKFNNKLLLKGSLAVLYRVPTLNDLYWKPGGNPDLKPEKGLTESLFIAWNTSKKLYNVNLEAGIFNTRTKDEIVWIPGTNGLYNAENINEIWSRGIEGTLKGNCSFKNLLINGFITPHYTLSTITKTATILNDAVGNQLSYTPKILIKTNLGIKFNHWSFNYFHDFTDERYTTLNNDQTLKSFQVGELTISWEKQINKSYLNIFVSVKNIWNEEYQVIAYRAMPGRSYQVGLVLKIK